MFVENLPQRRILSFRINIFEFPDFSFFQYFQTFESSSFLAFILCNFFQRVPEHLNYLHTLWFELKYSERSRIPFNEE